MAFRSKRITFNEPHAGAKLKVYADVATVRDLLADGPGGNVGPFRVIVWGGGTLTIKNAAGDSVDLGTLPDGALLEDYEIIELSSGTATNIHVLW